MRHLCARLRTAEQRDGAFLTQSLCCRLHLHMHRGLLRVPWDSVSLGYLDLAVSSELLLHLTPCLNVIFSLLQIDLSNLGDSGLKDIEEGPSDFVPNADFCVQRSSEKRPPEHLGCSVVLHLSRGLINLYLT